MSLACTLGEEISLQYLFQLHAELEPIEYQLAITVFYQVDKLTYSTTYFNQVRVIMTKEDDDDDDGGGSNDDDVHLSYPNIYICISLLL
jgi:hypothetical protein